MSNIAIIPARGGSKRIPKKNIKSFCGKPIIVYSIEVALASNLFDEVMVSTEDEEIAEISRKFGAKVPFMRSSKNADDYATTFEVLEEVLNKYAYLNKQFKFGCCIYPTAPFTSVTVLQQAYKKLTEQNFNTVFPIVKYAYTIWRSLKLQNEKTTMWFPENLHARSQDLPPAYHDAGQFYWFNTEKLLKEKSMFTNNSGAVTIDELHAQDIDNMQDWHMAELKYKYLLRQNFNE